MGNNIVNIALSSLATALAVSLFGSAGVGIATASVTIIVLVFGEIIPKSIALTYPEKIALRFSAPLSIFAIFALPVIATLSIITSFILFITGYRQKPTTEPVTEEDLRTLIEVGEEEGVLVSEERKILQRILDFTDLIARDIMTPRTALITVTLETSLNELRALSLSTGLSRFPVLGEDIDDIVGIVYIKDLLISAHPNNTKLSARNIMRQAFFVFETQSIPVLQERLRTENQNCAIVLDEYGGTAGMITIEDVFEEIFGSIQDEFDFAELPLVQTHNRHKVVQKKILIPGAERLETVNTLLDIQLESRFFDTIAGFILERAGDIPTVGYEVVDQNYVFTVKEVSGNRIETVRIEYREDAE